VGAGHFLSLDAPDEIIRAVGDLTSNPQPSQRLAPA
jgi:hypothetical protein